MDEELYNSFMENHPWEKAYNNNSFEITTNKPSVIVEKYRDRFNKGDNVLDIGCGNGRNAIFLSSLGCNVDCFDVAELQWKEKLNQDIKNRINFSKSTITDFNYELNKYKSVIIARVIQYLNNDELKKLIDNVYLSLTNDVFLLLSFNSDGGIFNQDQIKVPKYKYSIEEIKELLGSKFKEIDIKEGAKKSQNVNYESDINTYDIFAKGKK